MYCSYCGTKIPDDSLFCNQCGAKLRYMDEAPEKVVERVGGSEAVETCKEHRLEQERQIEKTASPKVNLRRNIGKEVLNQLERWIDSLRKTFQRGTEKWKSPVINRISKTQYTIAVITVFAALIAVVLIGCFINYMNIPAYIKQRSEVYAKMTEDGIAYIPLESGKYLEIHDKVKTAVLTGNEKQVVVLLSDGSLYVTDPRLSEKHKITANAERVNLVRDDGFVFTDKDGVTYRVLFVDYALEEIGQVVDVISAENSVSLLLTTSEGKIYIMANNSYEKEQIGASEETELIAISDDGQTAIWIDNEYYTYSAAMMYSEGQRYLLGQVNAKENNTYVMFTHDQKLATVVNAESDCMWVKKAGEEPIEVKLGDKLFSANIYSDKGNLWHQNASRVKSLYVSVDGNFWGNIYNISLDGERERVLSEVVDYYIADNQIVYLNSENTLYYAEINGADISNETRISGEVDMFEVSDNGEYVYYMKDSGEYVGSLYCFKLGTEEAVKIATDVLCWNWKTVVDFTLMHIDISTDGKTVYYLTDVHEAGNTNLDQGTLMKWEYGTETSERIASEVMNHSVTSSLKCGEIDPDNFTFWKFYDVDAGGTVYFHWVHHNGKENKIMAEELIYK